MTEAEARKLIEPYSYVAIITTDPDGELLCYVVKDFDVITLLMEHSQSSKRLEKIRKRIEAWRDEDMKLVTIQVDDVALNRARAYQDCLNLFPPEQTKENENG
jgi:hypothetical protein